MGDTVCEQIARIVNWPDGLNHPTATAKAEQPTRITLRRRPTRQRFGSSSRSGQPTRFTTRRRPTRQRFDNMRGSQRCSKRHCSAHDSPTFDTRVPTSRTGSDLTEAHFSGSGAARDVRSRGAYSTRDTGALRPGSWANHRNSEHSTSKRNTEVPSPYCCIGLRRIHHTDTLAAITYQNVRPAQQRYSNNPSPCRSQDKSSVGSFDEPRK